MHSLMHSDSGMVIVGSSSKYARLHTQSTLDDQSKAQETSVAIIQFNSCAFT